MYEIRYRQQREWRDTQSKSHTNPRTKTEQLNVIWMEEIAPLKTEDKEEEDEDNMEDEDDMIKDAWHHKSQKQISTRSTLSQDSP